MYSYWSIKTILAVILSSRCQFVQCVCVTAFWLEKKQPPSRKLVIKVQWDVLRDRYFFRVCICEGLSEPAIKWCGVALPSCHKTNPNGNNKEMHIDLVQLQLQFKNDPNIQNMLDKLSPAEEKKKRDNRQWQMICVAFLWRHPTGLNTHPYAIVWTIHVFIQTQAQESARPQWSKNKTHITHTAKRPLFNTCVISQQHAGKPPLSLGAAIHVFIWASCKHSDLWLVLQVQPMLWNS